jgi:hypothetical protein
LKVHANSSGVKLYDLPEFLSRHDTILFSVRCAGDAGKLFTCLWQGNFLSPFTERGIQVSMISLIVNRHPA